MTVIFFRITCSAALYSMRTSLSFVFSHIPIDTTKLGKLAEALTRTDWVNVLAGKSVSECYDAFIQHFNVLMDEYIPVKRTEIPHRSIVREPWMTPGLMKSFRKRDLMYRKTVGKSRDSISYERYLRSYRNMYNSIKKTCKACIL